MAVLSITGCLTSVLYHQACLIAEDVALLSQKSAQPLSVHLRPLISYTWLSYLSTRHPHHHPDQPIVTHSLLGTIGTLDHLVSWAIRDYAYEDVRSQGGSQQAQVLTQALHRLADEALSQYISQQVQYSYAYMDLQLPAATHQMVFEVYPDLCPRAVSNFLQLCEGLMIGDQSLHYLGCPVHRVVPHSYFQSGDVINGHGDNNSYSSYGRVTFADESYALSHNQAGVLSMVNDGHRHTNGTQFMVTLAARPQFDGRYVAFGRLIKGEEVLVALNAATPYYPYPAQSQSQSQSGAVAGASVIQLKHERPLVPVTIVGCGRFTTDLLASSVTAWTKKSTGALSAAALTSTVSGSAGVSAVHRATVVVIGMEGAGKTTLVQHWCGNGAEGVATPTIGFELDQLSVGKYHVAFYGLGGSSNIRGYWNNYYDAAHAVVFVVDQGVTDSIYWQEAQQEWQQLLQHSMIKAKPLLVLGNNKTKKLASTQATPRDSIGAGRRDSSKVDVSPLLLQYLSMENVAGCPHQILACDLSNGYRVGEGLTWLLATIDQHFSELDVRVTADVAERKRLAKEAMQRRREQLAAEKEQPKVNVAAKEPEEEKTAESEQQMAEDNSSIQAKEAQGTPDNLQPRERFEI